LRFEEFEKRVGKQIYTSATPGPYERKKSSQIVEQIIRPTGLTDPKLTIRPARGQVDDLIPRIEERVKAKERVLVTTLTKRMAEDLADYLGNCEVRDAEQNRSATKKKRTLRQVQGEGKQPIKVAYLHSDVKTLDRIRILTNLRKGNFDVLVGVNLLREGLDLPEVTLVAILDADKEGFLRSETSLIQTIGRAARNVRGEVLIYADHITGSVKRAVDETERRRKIQIAHNKRHNITPKTIEKKISDIVPIKEILDLETGPLPKSKKALKDLIAKKEKEMKEAAEKLDFELAAILRDELRALKTKELSKKRK
jgi:excinuclease ABC subunit B